MCDFLGNSYVYLKNEKVYLNHNHTLIDSREI